MRARGADEVDRQGFVQSQQTSAQQGARANIVNQQLIVNQRANGRHVVRAHYRRLRVIICWSRVLRLHGRWLRLSDGWLSRHLRLCPHDGFRRSMHARFCALIGHSVPIPRRDKRTACRPGTNGRSGRGRVASRKHGRRRGDTTRTGWARRRGARARARRGSSSSRRRSIHSY
jgi:hypothetical protein